MANSAARSIRKGELTADQLRPRPSSALLYDLAGGSRYPAGMIYGATDDFSYNITENPVHVHDLQATLLHLLGLRSHAADLPLPGPRLSA